MTHWLNVKNIYINLESKFAAGVKIEKSKLNLFSEHFEKTVKEAVNGNMFERKHKYDIEVSFSDLTVENVKIISRMSPLALRIKDQSLGQMIAK